jgi:hypothetical protein
MIIQNDSDARRHLTNTHQRTNDFDQNKQRYFLDIGAAVGLERFTQLNPHRIGTNVDDGISFTVGHR